jgi:hypothetical protein
VHFFSQQQGRRSMRTTFHLFSFGLLTATLAACGGRSQTCQRALECGSDLSSIGKTVAEEQVKLCERVAATVETCCQVALNNFRTSGTAVGTDGELPETCRAQ